MIKIETVLDIGESITAYKFLKEDGQPAYLLCGSKEERSIDLSSELKGQVLVTNANGKESIEDSSEISLNEELLIVQHNK